MSRRHSPAAARSRDAILGVLARVLPRPATVLEIGSGTGEHAVFVAARLAWLTWQPSDPDPASLASIEAWRAEAGLPNVLPPLRLDLLARAWRLQRCDALVAVNVLHVAPAGASDALLAGAAEVLPRGGPLVVAGPFADPELAGLVDEARRQDLALQETVAMPDGCRLVVLRRS
jgi:SAM-dependent methyltransferase